MIKLLSRFENGLERYNTDPLFHRVIDMIYVGANPFDIINLLITMNNDQQKQLKELIMKSSFSITLSNKG